MRLLAGVDEIGLRGRERLHADVTPQPATPGIARRNVSTAQSKACGRVTPAEQRPLLRRAEDHQVAAQIAAWLRQRDEVVGRPRAHRGVGRRECKPSVLASSQCSPTISRPGAGSDDSGSSRAGLDRDP